MRMVVLASHTLSIGGTGREYTPLNYADSIYLATRGGAVLLDMEQSLGSLDTGKLADFIVVDLTGKYRQYFKRKNY